MLTAAFKALVRGVTDGVVGQASDEMRQLQRASVCIVSYPKSGRTWLRAMLGKALCERHGLDEQWIMDGPMMAAPGIPPILFTHDGSRNTDGRHWNALVADKAPYRDKTVVLLVRDPRDVVVSCFFQATRRKGVYEGSLSAFVRDDRYGIRKVVTFLNQWHAARSTPRDLLVMSYEGMKDDPAAALRSALAFIGVDGITSAIVDTAVTFAGFDNMRAMEAEGRFPGKRMRPGESGDPESFKVRRGKVGGFVDYLSDEDQTYCNGVIRELGCPFVPMA